MQNFTSRFNTTLKIQILPLCIGAASLWAPVAAAEETVVDKTAVGAKELVYTVVDKSEYTVSFKKGSALVDQSAKNSLKALFKSLKGELKGADVVIGAWSDRDFPLDPEVKLSADDAKLAKARASNVEKAVKSLGVKNSIQLINFGEQNSLLSKMFKLGSDAPEVKDAVQTGTTDSRKVAAVAKRMHDNGGPEKAVVLIRREADPVR